MSGQKKKTLLSLVEKFSDPLSQDGASGGGYSAEVTPYNLLGICASRSTKIVL